MIKKNILVPLLLSFFLSAAAQVGINTEKPTSALDVNGSIRTVGNLKVGGSETSSGSAGTAGQFLISKGEGFAPEWQTANLPITEQSDWVLLSSVSRVDKKGGFKFASYEATGAYNYPSDYTVTKFSGNIWAPDYEIIPWREFEDFALDLPAYEDTLRVVIHVQVLVQAYWPVYTTQRESWMSYALGIFRENPRVGAADRTARMLVSRQGNANGSGVTGSNTPQKLMTMIHTIDIPPGQDTKLMILATHRANFIPPGNVTNRAYLIFGRNLDNATSDETLLRQATMRADIYRKTKKNDET